MIYHLVLPSVKLYYSLMTPRFIILFVVLHGDISLFQNDLDSATLWSTRYNMFFNPKKSVHLYINAKIITNYKIADTQVLTNSSHKNLGIIISSDLSWDQHYKNIIPKTYRMLGLLHRSWSSPSIGLFKGLHPSSASSNKCIGLFKGLHPTSALVCARASSKGFIQGLHPTSALVCLKGFIHPLV